LLALLPRRWGAAIWILPALIPAQYAFIHGVAFLWMLGCVAVALAAQQREYTLPVPGGRRLLEWVGSRSYGIYLVHPVAIHLLEELNHRTRGSVIPGFPLLWVGLALATTLLLSEISIPLGRAAAPRARSAQRLALGGAQEPGSRDWSPCRGGCGSLRRLIRRPGQPDRPGRSSGAAGLAFRRSPASRSPPQARARPRRPGKDRAVLCGSRAPRITGRRGCGSSGRASPPRPNLRPSGASPRRSRPA